MEKLKRENLIKINDNLIKMKKKTFQQKNTLIILIL